MNGIVFVEPAFLTVADHYVFNIATESFMYIELCPFAYDFTKEDWWYVFEGNTGSEGFWIYSFKDERWYFVIGGFLIEV